MKYFIKISLAIVALIFLSACENPKEGVAVSDDTSNVITTSIVGNVIDGYISGAVVYLDLNTNNYWDDGEPKVVTASDGSFSFVNIILDNKSFIPVVSVGGKDTATNNAFEGKLRNIIDTSTLSNNSTNSLLVTPLTDLISTLFLESETKTTSSLSLLTNSISNVYGITDAYGVALDIINLNPMADAGVFAKTQEVQQTKLLIETSVKKAKNSTLTSAELELLRYNIKKAIVLQINKFKYLDINQVLSDLESDLNLVIPANEKSFIVAQREEIKKELTAFASADNNITVENLNDFQVELEKKQATAFDILNNAQETDTLSVVSLNIDIFEVPTVEPEPEQESEQESEPTSEIVSLEGTVVDGYIKEAVVCLDTDFNGICTYGEPSTTSSSTGKFTFSNVKIYQDTFISIIASGGVDTATDKLLLGELKTVLDTNNIQTKHQFNITPITDLIATSFLKSSVKNSLTLDGFVENMAITYRIEKAYTDKQPIEYERVFAVTQEIQQTKALIEVAAMKAKTISLTSLERKELQIEINQATIMEINGTLDLDVKSVLSNLENMTHNLIPENEKDFIVAQVREIKLALDSFVQSKDLTVDNLDEYQLALEKEADSIYTLFNSIDGNETINPIVLNIDIFKVPDVNDSTQVEDKDDEVIEVVENNVTQISFSGVLVDDYIDGATVCLDLDSSGICDLGEPFVTTEKNGVFNFSNIEVTKDTLIPLIGFSGVDISTNKTYIGELKTIIYTSDVPNDTIVVSPLVDLSTTDYLEKSSKTTLTLMQSMIDISTAFTSTVMELYVDPMKSTKIFMLTQKMEYTKRILQRVIEETISTTYTTSQTRDLQKKIKKILVENILEYGYEGLSIDRIIVALEIDLQIEQISDSYKSFTKNQLIEIYRVLDDLSEFEEVYLYTLPRIQNMLEAEVEDAYTHIEYADINMTRERVVNSIYTKVDAIYDEFACTEDAHYRNVLTDSNASTQRTQDVDNGISINSEIDGTSIYYTNLDITKSGRNVPVFFGERDYFSFDEAWINKNENIYIKVSNDEENNYICYKAKLNSNLASEIDLIKVYNYSD